MRFLRKNGRFLLMKTKTERNVYFFAGCFSYGNGMIFGEILRFSPHTYGVQANSSEYIRLTLRRQPAVR